MHFVCWQLTTAARAVAAAPKPNPKIVQSILLAEMNRDTIAFDRLVVVVVVERPKTKLQAISKLSDCPIFWNIFL